MTDEVRATRASVEPGSSEGISSEGAYLTAGVAQFRAILAPGLVARESGVGATLGLLSFACGHNERGQRSGVGCGHAVCTSGTEYSASATTMGAARRSLADICTDPGQRCDHGGPGDARSGVRIARERLGIFVPLRSQTAPCWDAQKALLADTQSARVSGMRSAWDWGLGSCLCASSVTRSVWSGHLIRPSGKSFWTFRVANWELRVVDGQGLVS